MAGRSRREHPQRKIEDVDISFFSQLEEITKNVGRCFGHKYLSDARYS